MTELETLINIIVTYCNLCPCDEIYEKCKEDGTYLEAIKKQCIDCWMNAAKEDKIDK